MSLSARLRMEQPRQTPLKEPSLAVSTPAVGIVASSDATEIQKPVLERRLMGGDTSMAPPTMQIDDALTGGAGGDVASVSAAKQEGDDTNAPQTAEGNEGEDGQRVSAYARLDFDSFTFYVQTLEVILGRRPENGTSMVDVHLGPAKAISRRHAKIFFNFATQQFELTVMGRNGAFVCDEFVDSGSTVPLEDGTQIQIGEIPFTFILPPGQSNGVKHDANDDPIKSEELALQGSPMARRSRKSEKVDTGDENNFFAVHGDESAGPSSGPPPTRKKPRREYKPEEIPVEYREKPSHSYSHLITTALQERAPKSGMSLADIYEAIMDLFPYYRYCPPGWQNSVRHNLSSSKAFEKLTKEGKAHLWGLNQEHLAAKEEQKKKAAARQLRQQQAAAAAAQQAQQRAGQPEKTIAELAQEIPARPRPQTGLSQDTVKLLGSLQQRLQQQLALAGQPAINPQILTNALAVVIAQAAKSAGGIQNLDALLKNPQAAQTLMVQALELMKRQAAKPGDASSEPKPEAATSSLASQAAAAAAPSLSPGTAAATLAPAAAAAAAVTALPPQAQAPAVSAAPEPTETSPVASTPSAPEPAAAVAPTPAATASEPSAGASVSPAAPSAPIEGALAVPAASSSTAPAAAAGAATSGPSQLEKIVELLEKAEQIPNPTPHIQSMIEQLRQHKRQLELKRPAQTELEAAAKRPN